MRKSYEILAQAHGVRWSRRSYDPKDWEAGDVPNRCLSAATACLHGLTEAAAVLAAGWAPAIGFLHTGKPLSFVYDIADLWKLETVVPEVFRVAGLAAKGRLDMLPDRAVRLACRDAVRRTGLLAKIIPRIEVVLEAGALPRPEPPPEALGPASGDDGQRGLATAFAMMVVVGTNAPPRLRGGLAPGDPGGRLRGRLFGPEGTPQ